VGDLNYAAGRTCHTHAKHASLSRLHFGDEFQAVKSSQEHHDTGALEDQSFFH
jgi:hypothetical protein